MTNEEKIEKAASLAHEYKLQGYHCSESIIRAVPQALGIEFSDDVIKAATAFFGGGGGTRGRCGVIESCLIICSMLYGRLDAVTDDQPLRDLATELMTRFNAKFGSINCGTIKAGEVEKYGEEYGCMRIYEEGARLVTELLLDADKIIEGE